MPSGCPREMSEFCSFCQRARLTMTGPAGSSYSSPACVQLSATNAPFLMSRIEFLLERLKAHAPVGVDENLAFPAKSEIGLDDRLDRIDDLGFGKGRAHDVAERRRLVGGAAQGHLVIF